MPNVKAKTKESEPKGSLYQQFDSAIRATPELSEKIKAEALHRIKTDGLPQSFEVCKYGIKILYRNPDGTQLKYTSQRIERLNKSRSTSYHSETEFQYYRYRLSNSLINAGGFDLKYCSPPKYETGMDSPVFFTDTAIEAYKKGKKGGTVFATEGEAKGAVLSQNGIEAISFAGISMFKLDYNLKQQLTKRKYDNFVLIYDADFERLGKTNGFARPTQFLDSALKCFFDVKQFCQSEGLPIPNFYICTGKNESEGKGIDDVILKHKNTALDALKSLCSNFLLSIDQIHHDKILLNCSRFFGFLTDSRKYADRVFYAGAGEYLEDIADANNLTLNDFKNKIVIAPTGIGKSSQIRSFASKEFIIVAVPTNALQKDFEREAKAKGIDIFIFTSDTYKQQIEAEDKPLSGRKFIVTTYHSFEVLLDVLGSDAGKYNLIVDEAHNFTSSAKVDFIYNQLYCLAKSFRLFKSVILFTATDLPYFADTLHFEKWVFIVPSKIKKDILYYKNGKSKYTTAAKAATEAAANGALPLIVLNDKKGGLDKLKRNLDNYKTEFQTFNADTKKEEHHSKLLATGNVNAKLMVATSVIKEGINIYDAREHICLIIITPMHAAELEQFAARFRLAKSITIILLADPEKIDYKAYMSFSNVANREKRKAIAYCKANNEYEIEERKYIGELDTKLTEVLPVRFDDVSNEYEFCPLLLANRVFQIESWMQNKNPLLMLKYLQQFGWECGKTNTNDEGELVSVKLLNFKIDPADVQLSEPTDLTDFLEAVEQLKGSQCPLETAKEGENIYFPLFIELAENINPTIEDPTAKALKVFEDTAGVKSELDKLKRQLAFKKLGEKICEGKKTGIAGGRYKGLKAIEQIINAFCAKDLELSAKEVRELYILTTANTALFEYSDLSTMRNDRILKNLSRFLKYESFKAKRGGKTVSLYRFEIVDWL